MSTIINFIININFLKDLEKRFLFDSFVNITSNNII